MIRVGNNTAAARSLAPLRIPLMPAAHDAPSAETITTLDGYKRAGRDTQSRIDLTAPSPRHLIIEVLTTARDPKGLQRLETFSEQSSTHVIVFC